jgi:hypothetical protein
VTPAISQTDNLEINQARKHTENEAVAGSQPANGKTIRRLK